MKWTSELEAVLNAARALDPGDLPRFLGHLEEIRATALARLTTPAAQPAVHDELLDVKEAAKRLGVSVKYLYSNHARLPFTRSMGNRRLFSAQGIEKYIRANKPLTQLTR